MLNGQKALDDFISYIIAEKGLAKNTAIAYRFDLSKFLDFAKSINTDIDLLQHQDITEFLWKIKEDGLKPSSIYRMIESIRQLYKFLTIEDLLKDNPAENISIPHVPNNLTDILSIEEVDLLLKSVDDDNITNIRNRAMFELLYATGLRNSELISLRFSDINLDDNFLKVIKGKGSKERLVPFGDTAKMFLKIYLGKRKPPQSQNDYVFISRLSKGTKITRQALWQQIKATALKAGIDKNIYPHIFRHSCASHMLAGGADIRFVQEILGHSSISSTERYTHLDAREIQSKHKKFHPRG